MNPQVDEHLASADTWQKELAELRRIALDCGLVEEYKWRSPCYTYSGSNVILLNRFKDYCALGFFKGALLQDAEGLLQKPGENTQSARLIRFTEVQQIIDLEPVIKAYIREAIEAEKAGLKVEFKKEIGDIPDELQSKFDEMPEFQAAFEALTPGRQRAYILYISAAKQSATRTSRIEKYMDRIFDGKGMHDCVCGHSRKYPQCDGSHKYYQS